MGAWIKCGWMYERGDSVSTPTLLGIYPQEFVVTAQTFTTPMDDLEYSERARYMLLSIMWHYRVFHESQPTDHLADQMC